MQWEVEAQGKAVHHHTHPLLNLSLVKCIASQGLVILCCTSYSSWLQLGVQQALQFYVPPTMAVPAAGGALPAMAMAPLV